MKIIAITCLAAVWLCVHVQSLFAQGPRTGRVVAGTAVAGVALGSDVDQFRQVFPKQASYGDRTNGLPDGCPQESHSWFDFGTGDGGVEAYIRQHQIDQISVHTSRFSLPRGLRLGDSEQKVRSAFPNGHGYTLLYSGGKVNGGRELEYWVDPKEGIAFEFCCANRKLIGVDIFNRGGTFRPQGCVSPPQVWQAWKKDRTIPEKP